MRKSIKHSAHQPKGKPDHGASRHVVVDVDVDALQADDNLAVDLFDGSTVALDLARVQYHKSGGFTWHGKDGKALLSVVGHAISGTIMHDGKQYQLQTQADGSTLLRKIDQSLFPPDHPNG